MKRYVVLNKNVGETPLEALTAWKRANPAYQDVPASYAGRLDPMAEGKLLILLGEECKRQNRYTGLDKEYEIEVLLDAGSDTGDALGLVSYSGRETRVSDAHLARVLRTERGAHTRPYPSYSSKTVNGKPLFTYALAGTLDSIVIPEHEERIYSADVLGTRRVSDDELCARITTHLALTPITDDPRKELGENFRIGAVRASWEELFARAGARDYAVITLRVACASGTYMRALAGRIGAALGTKALALSIKRTRIGKRRLGFWFPDYR